MYRPVARSVGAKRLYRFLVGRRLCERAARVIATSELERRQLLGEGLAPDRVAVRRNGIDLTPFAELPPRGRFRRDRGIASETRLILFLGRLAAVKSIPLLVRAFAALTPPSARLVIAGPHETPGDRQTLIDLTERLGVGSRVLFTGALYGAAKVEALVDADVLVLPSQSESFGIAAAEAMACGTPVIVTDQCGIAPYVHDRAGLVVPHEAAAVTAALQRLLGDAALAARCRAQGPVAARALSWDEPLQQLERLYHNVVAGGRQPRRRPAPRPA
jgi:glycosyltransferase involved in cell wall biosynthesis